ncbi:MAG: 3'-5' exonuclease [Dehalococcoidia bacterium]
MTRRNVPFHRYGGLRFLETAHIKDLISFLRILENPRDEIAWLRVLHLLSGVGPVTATSILDHIQNNQFDSSTLVTLRAPVAARREMASSLLC